jgi:hypothetical protein
MHRVVTRRRTVIRAVVMVVMVMNRAVMHRVMHNDHTTRLRHRQCRHGKRRDG